MAEDVYSILKIEGYTKVKLEKTAKQNLAISLFSEGVLFFGKAAELAGMDKWNFLDLLREKKIPFMDKVSKDIKREDRM